ncbi:MAG: pro-sigmaK processing inhibitor BofA family protein [Clostridia bacterium]|nr:pro-sigmaK processing inhibitor BofA family protein [Clostridia bacterium]MBQ1966628.1 pro-sigmaK processing inhibitor BofA family protein [Clostridia bacterium]MBQ5906010.1 pro-sigmaK processing inhibitor BofA family protein [Clostridia bacterium]
MSIGSYIIFAFLILSGIIILAVTLRNEKPFKNIFLSLFSGIGSLFAVNIASAITAVSLPVNTLTLSVSAVGGIPGVVLLLISDVLLS